MIAILCTDIMAKFQKQQVFCVHPSAIYKIKNVLTRHDYLNIQVGNQWMDSDFPKAQCKV